MGRPRKTYEDEKLAALRDKQREAMNKYYLEHREEILQAKRKNKEPKVIAEVDEETLRVQRAEYHRQWLQAHPGKTHEYYLRAQDKHKESAKAWAQRNVEKTKQLAKQYRQRQKEEIIELRKKANKADMLQQQVDMLMNKVALLA
jgi:hypothetical protein